MLTGTIVNIAAAPAMAIARVVPTGMVPQLYSKLAASQELRKMLNIGRADDRSDVSRLSDAELVQQLSDQAKQLRVDINLNYSFAQPPTPDKDEQG
jgi:hypothetical protein